MVIMANNFLVVRGLKPYISPSDTIMSPCTAKLSAYKSKHFLKYVGFPSVGREFGFGFGFLILVFLSSYRGGVS